MIFLIGPSHRISKQSFRALGRLPVKANETSGTNNFSFIYSDADAPGVNHGLHCFECETA
ncbi:hypothetical protein Bsp3421_002945 [Burkholderia sp. FERM BP-3421]|jgi:hypothetical protein|uniref:hypothetical protein n=1 Tax=Burkholderia sp. FERM BP-3421 TaxID=1494466 RepID=UPI002362F1F3|nr:hypothetical protein [Burkholderia sp. FERM BP-3421]WDD92908.1 hypothetical protein Bsp3421_002945 [Burkholderia sp. FERM BP-3421]